MINLGQPIDLISDPQCFEENIRKIIQNRDIVTCGEISGWLEFFKPWAITKLQKNDEIIVIKSIKQGKTLLDAMKQMFPKYITQTNTNNMLFALIVKNKQIREMVEIIADIEQKDNLDQILDSQEGIVRICDA